MYQEVRYLRLLLAAAEEPFGHNFLSCHQHASRRLRHEHILIQGAIDARVAQFVRLLHMHNGPVRTQGAYHGQFLTAKGVAHGGKVGVRLAQIALPQPGDRHKGQAISRGAQRRDDGVARVLVGLNAPLLHPLAIMRAQAKVAFVADKPGIHAVYTACQAEQVHIHRACGFHQPQPALLLPGQLIHSGHGRAVEGVATQGKHRAIRDGLQGVRQTCQLAHLAALAAMCTASHTLEKGGA